MKAVGEFARCTDRRKVDANDMSRHVASPWLERLTWNDSRGEIGGLYSIQEPVVWWLEVLWYTNNVANSATKNILWDWRDEGGEEEGRDQGAGVSYKLVSRQTLR